MADISVTKLESLTIGSLSYPSGGSTPPTLTVPSGSSLVVAGVQAYTGNESHAGAQTITGPITSSSTNTWSGVQNMTGTENMSGAFVSTSTVNLSAPTSVLLSKITTASFTSATLKDGEMAVGALSNTSCIIYVRSGNTTYRFLAPIAGAVL